MTPDAIALAKSVMSLEPLRHQNDEECTCKDSYGPTAPYCTETMRANLTAQQYADLVDDAAPLLAAALLEAHRELEEMRAARDEACDLAEEGWGYASDYFREKWLHPSRIAALRAIGGDKL